MLREGNVHSADDWHSLLEPVVARYRDANMRRYFRGDAAFADPDLYTFLEEGGYVYAIRLPGNQNLQRAVGYLLARPVGRLTGHPFGERRRLTRPRAHSRQN